MPLLVFLFGFMFFSTANWIIRKYGPVTYEQIIFHLNMPFSSEIRLVLSYWQNTLMTGIILSLLLWLMFSQKYRIKFTSIEKMRDILYKNRWMLSCVWLIFCVIYFCLRMNVWSMITHRQYKRQVSSFYEQYYVMPQQTDIVFPANQRNLIIIFME